jgi:hypothetical protein
LAGSASTARDRLVRAHLHCPVTKAIVGPTEVGVQVKGWDCRRDRLIPLFGNFASGSGRAEPDELNVRFLTFGVVTLIAGQRSMRVRGVDLQRSTPADWVGLFSRLLAPVVDQLRGHVLHSVQTTFCIHLIAISGSQRWPKVRMLFVATAGADAVYEGQGSWSKCLRWILQLPFDITQEDLAAARREVGRDQYATLPLVKALSRPRILGLQRVDR